MSYIDYFIQLIQSVDKIYFIVLAMFVYMVWSNLTQKTQDQIINSVLEIIDKRFNTSLAKKKDNIDERAMQALESKLDLSDDYIEYLKNQVLKIEAMQRQIDELLPLKPAQKELLKTLQEQEHKIASQDQIIKEMDETIQDIIKQRDDAIATAEKYARQIKELEEKHDEEISCYTKRVEVLEKELAEMKSKWNTVYKSIQSVIGIKDTDIDSLMSILDKLGKDLGINE